MNSGDRAAELDAALDRCDATMAANARIKLDVERFLVEARLMVQEWRRAEASSRRAAWWRWAESGLMQGFCFGAAAAFAFYLLHAVFTALGA